MWERGGRKIPRYMYNTVSISDILRDAHGAARECGLKGRLPTEVKLVGPEKLCHWVPFVL